VSHKEEHPTCHLLAVTMDGKECLLDVSFKGVKIGEITLLELTHREVENRNQKFSWVILNIWQDVLWVVLKGSFVILKKCWSLFTPDKTD
jgi:hypothetical protein